MLSASRKSVIENVLKMLLPASGDRYDGWLGGDIVDMVALHRGVLDLSYDYRLCRSEL